MNNQDFNCSITANTTAEEAMDAISRIADWWKKDFTGSTKNLNDEFTVHFGGTTFVQFKTTEVVPNAKLVWTVTDCYLSWLSDKTEWTGTKVIFEISTKNNQTAIHFTHEGLTPSVECYDMCVKGWTQYNTGQLAKAVGRWRGATFLKILQPNKKQQTKTAFRGGKIFAPRLIFPSSSDAIKPNSRYQKFG